MKSSSLDRFQCACSHFFFQLQCPYVHHSAVHITVQRFHMDGFISCDADSAFPNLSVISNLFAMEYFLGEFSIQGQLEYTNRKVENMSVEWLAHISGMVFGKASENSVVIRIWHWPLSSLASLSIFINFKMACLFIHYYVLFLKFVWFLFHCLFYFS